MESAGQKTRRGSPHRQSHKRSFADMAHQATLSPSPLLFGYSPSPSPLVETPSPVTFSQRRRQHPHNHNRPFQTPYESRSRNMASSFQPGSRRSVLEHRREQTVIDLTDETDDVQIVRRPTRTPSSQRPPPQLGRSDTQSLADVVIDLTAEDEGEESPDLEVVDERPARNPGVQLGGGFFHGPRVLALPPLTDAFPGEFDPDNLFVQEHLAHQNEQDSRNRQSDVFISHSHPRGSAAAGTEAGVTTAAGASFGAGLRREEQQQQQQQQQRFPFDFGVGRLGLPGLFLHRQQSGSGGAGGGGGGGVGAGLARIFGHSGAPTTAVATAATPHRGQAARLHDAELFANIPGAMNYALPAFPPSTATTPTTTTTTPPLAHQYQHQHQLYQQHQHQLHQHHQHHHHHHQHHQQQLLQLQQQQIHLLGQRRGLGGGSGGGFGGGSFGGGGGGAREPPKPQHKPPRAAREGFTRSPATEDGDVVVVCPGCEEELVARPAEQLLQGGDNNNNKEKPPARKSGRAPSKKEREEHPFWVVKDCGHVYCNDCYQNRKSSAKSRMAGEKKKPICAVEDCSSGVGGSDKWVGVFL